MPETERRAKAYFLARLEGRWADVAGAFAGEPEEVKARVAALWAAEAEAGEFLAGPAMPDAGEDDEWPAGTMLGGRYELLEVLGEGAFARVYRAVDRRIAGKAVAVKVFHSGVLTQTLLEPETRAMSRINHPGIVRVMDVGETEEGRLYLVRDYFAGETLRARMGRGRMGEEAAVAVVRQMAEALGEAHGVGLVHCDVKPENILIDARGRVALIDFGLQDLFEGKRREVLRTSNTYAAPELLAGMKPAAAADLYSLGCVWVEMLTGERPGRGANGGAVPVKWRGILGRLRDADPRRRPGSARVLVEELDAGGRRKRVLLGAGMVGVALLTGALLTRGMAEREPVVAGLTPVTSFGGEERNPSLSPEGDYVVFRWQPEGLEREAIYGMPVAGGTPVRLSPKGEEAWAPVISPDGKQVAYLTHEAARDRGELRVVPVAGGASRAISDLWVTGFDWMPDGREMLVSMVSGDDPARHVLAVVDAGSGRWRQVSPNDGKNRRNPVVAPDGKRVAYTVKKGDGPTRLVVGELGGGVLEDRHESATYPDVRSPAWSPDGRHVLFAAGRSNNRHVHAARWDDLGHARLLPGFGQRLDWITVARRRTVAVVSQSQSDQNIWRIELEGPGGAVTGAKVISETTWDDEEPSISSATGRLLFISDQSGGEQVWETGYEGEGTRRLTDFADAHEMAVWALPGKKRALVSGRFGTEVGYTVLDLAGVERVRDPANVLPGRVVGVSGDGEAAYVTLEGKLRLTPFDGGAGKEVALDNPDRVVEGAGGKGVWHTTRFDSRIWHGGKAAGGIIERRAFAVGREGVYFVERLRPSVLQYRGFADGKARDLVKLAGPVGFGMALRADERMIAIAVFDREGSDLLAVKDFRLF